MWVNAPSTRRRKSDHIPQTLMDANPNYRFTIAANSNTIQTLTINNPLKRSTVAHINQANNTKPRWYAIFVRVTNVSFSPPKPMHIGINNSLQSVSLYLCIPENDEHRMGMLVDTGTVVNTANLQNRM